MIRLISGATVCGYSRSDFQRDGKNVLGFMVYFTFPLSSEGSRGDSVGSLWVSKEFMDSHVIEVGASLNVARVRQGDMSKFQLVS